ncbi:MAG: hypothetical protein OEW04_07455 [Nitrospirota bacterium]|nr:hypothetical protein [Nitrospirota bacterium]
MKSDDTKRETAIMTPTAGSGRLERMFVWTVWSVMVIIALVCILRYGRSIPLAEDWLLVSPLTGNEPDLPSWLWAQNNEHRIPLPRLLLLGLLSISHGDFRAGMFLNTLLLGTLAFFMILSMKRLRGRTRFADAFFPAALLHIGNWPNLVWGWQLTYVLPTVVTCAVFLIIVRSPALSTPGPALFAGTCLVLLPLCGANGLLFVPFLALWLIYCGVLNWRQDGKRWISGFLISSSAITILLALLYFIGYERPYWNPPSPGFGATLKTAAKFIALGLGPAAEKSWRLAVLAAAVFLVPGAVMALLGVVRHRGLERHRALGVFLFLGNLAVFALAMGWGRAGLVPREGLPIRYVLLAVPAFCAAFFAWELYGPARLKTAAQTGLLLVMALLLPSNMTRGLYWGEWYRNGMDAIEQDILSGTPRSTLAESHREFLIHWWDAKQLEKGMLMLQDAGMGPFSKVRETRVISEDLSFSRP